MAKQKFSADPEDEKPVEQPVESGDEASEESETHITMYRDPEFHPAPHTANVHRDEVVNFSLGGWRTEAEMNHEAEARANAAKK